MAEVNTMVHLTNRDWGHEEDRLCQKHTQGRGDRGGEILCLLSLSYMSNERLGLAIDQLPLEAGNPGNAVCRGPLTCSAEQSR